MEENYLHGLSLQDIGLLCNWYEEIRLGVQVDDKAD